jgi:hypothetical protein
MTCGRTVLVPVRAWVGFGAGGHPDSSGGIGVEEADASAHDDVEPAGGEPEREDADGDDRQIGEGVVAGGEPCRLREAAAVAVTHEQECRGEVTGRRSRRC